MSANKYNQPECNTIWEADLAAELLFSSSLKHDYQENGYHLCMSKSHDYKDD